MSTRELQAILTDAHTQNRRQRRARARRQPLDLLYSAAVSINTTTTNPNTANKVPRRVDTLPEDLVVPEFPDSDLDDLGHVESSSSSESVTGTTRGIERTNMEDDTTLRDSEDSDDDYAELTHKHLPQTPRPHSPATLSRILREECDHVAPNAPKVPKMPPLKPHFQRVAYKSCPWWWQIRHAIVVNPQTGEQRIHNFPQGAMVRMPPPADYQQSVGVAADADDVFEPSLLPIVELSMDVATSPLP